MRGLAAFLVAHVAWVALARADEPPPAADDTTPTPIAGSEPSPPVVEPLPVEAPPPAVAAPAAIEPPAEVVEAPIAAAPPAAPPTAPKPTAGRIVPPTLRLRIEEQLPTTPTPRVTSLRAEVPPALDQLVGELMAKDPNDRPADIEALLVELGRLRNRRS